MTITMRPFSFEANLDEVRKFLLEVYESTRALHYLIPLRIENQKHGPCGPDYSPADEEVFKIWQITGEEPEILALSHRGSAGNYHIEIHPKHKGKERELFLKIEELEASIRQGEAGRMYMYTVGSDTERPKVLAQLGYEDYGLHEHNYHLPDDAVVHENPAPEGFTVRGLRGEEDYSAFIELVGSVFEHCGQFITVEKMRFMAQAQFYRDDLHLVAIDRDGRFVAFCFYRIDPLTKIAEVEAVGSRQEVANLGLEKVLIAEGARRLRKHNPAAIYSVEVDLDDDMNEWLEAAGFTKSVTMNMWGKIIG